MAEQEIIEPEVKPDELTEEQKQAAETEAKQKADEQAELERKEQEETEKKPWFQKRFAEITKQKYDEKQRADAAEKKAQDLEARIQKLEKTKEPEFKPTRPRPEEPDFNTYVDKHDDPDEAYSEYSKALAKYTDDLTDWKLEQRDAKATQKRERETKKAEEQKVQQSFYEKAAAIRKAGLEKFNDYDEVVGGIPLPLIPIQLQHAITELNDGDSVIYYLGKNLQEAERISKLPPYAMAAELGKVEMKISNTQKKQTKAPEPIKPLKGKTPASSEIDPGKDPKGWIEARNRGEI